VARGACEWPGARRVASAGWGEAVSTVGGFVFSQLRAGECRAAAPAYPRARPVRQRLGGRRVCGVFQDANRPHNSVARMRPQRPRTAARVRVHASAARRRADTPRCASAGAGALAQGG